MYIETIKFAWQQLLRAFYGVTGTAGENPLSDESLDIDDPLTESSASSELSSLNSSSWVAVSSCLDVLVSGRLELKMKQCLK